MTSSEKIRLLLDRKQEIEQMDDGTFTANHRWLLDAVETLLRCQLELVENLRDQGLLR